MNKWLIAALVAAVILAGRNILYGFSIKEGVYGTLQPVMYPALTAVRRTWLYHLLGTPVITSIQDGTHIGASKHYEGLAFDIRLNDIDRNLHVTLSQEIASILGLDFDVLHESHDNPEHDHLHIEYDPK